MYAGKAPNLSAEKQQLLPYKYSQEGTEYSISESFIVQSCMHTLIHGR